MSGEPDALCRLVPLLVCPVCGSAMESATAGVVCAAGHSFDRARQGHLTLFGSRGRRFPGDTAEQVVARDRVLASGLFEAVADALVDVTLAHPMPSSPVLLEAGAGTGFYLDRVVGAVRDDRRVLGVGTELSAAAARRLARISPDIAALVADTWERLPLADSAVDLVQVVFAPRNPGEFARVLRPGGLLVVAVPGPGHLEPLRSRAGMLTPAADKSDRLDADLATWFEPADVRHVDESVTTSAAIAVDLALMGPSGVHLDRDDLAAHLGDGDAAVRISVEVRTYRPLPR